MVLSVGLLVSRASIADLTEVTEVAAGTAVDAYEQGPLQPSFRTRCDVTVMASRQIAGLASRTRSYSGGSSWYAREISIPRFAWWLSDQKYRRPPARNVIPMNPYVSEFRDQTAGLLTNW